MLAHYSMLGATALALSVFGFWGIGLRLAGDLLLLGFHRNLNPNTGIHGIPGIPICFLGFRGTRAPKSESPITQGS